MLNMDTELYIINKKYDESLLLLRIDFKDEKQ